MGFLVLIIIIAAIIIIKFFIKDSQQKVEMRQQGGMINKYAVLISNILYQYDQYDNSKITRSSVDSLDIAVPYENGGTILFALTQTFGKLTVQCKIYSPIYGTNRAEWDFPEYLNQNLLIVS